MIDEAETTLSSIDNASDRLVQSVLKQAHTTPAPNHASGRYGCCYACGNCHVPHTAYIGGLYIIGVCCMGILLHNAAAGCYGAMIYWIIAIRDPCACPSAHCRQLLTKTAWAI